MKKWNLSAITIVIAAIMTLVLSGFIFAQTANAEDVAFAGLNLQADTAYLFTHKTFAVGAGTDVLKFKDGLVTVRGEILQTKSTASEKSATVGGVAATVNLPQLASQMGGNWVAKTINPSVGLFGGYDFNNQKSAIGVIVTILKVEF